MTKTADAHRKQTLAYPPMPLLPISSQETITASASMPLQPTDIFICSYPKSGTTWTQHIVLSLILADQRQRKLQKSQERTEDQKNVNRQGEKSGSVKRSNSWEDLSYEHVSDFAPFFEIDAHWDLANNCLTHKIRKNHEKLNRRVFNTHLRWDMLPKQQQHQEGRSINRASSDASSDRELTPECGKFIYVTRNLIDVCASFYHHLSNQKEGTYTESFDTFFCDWMEGNVAFGSPLHHLLSFAEGFADNRFSRSEVEGKPLLLLSYESMKKNLRSEVERIISFLHLDIPTSVLENELLPSFEFKTMRSNLVMFQPKSVSWLNGFQFLRKGIIGDGKNMVGESMLKIFQEWVQNEEYLRNIISLLSGTDDFSKDVFLSVVD